MTISLSALANYLDRSLGSKRFPHDQNGIYRSSSRLIKRIGLALEPWADIDNWVQQEQLDALFLHRPWDLNVQKLPHDAGVLAYHLAFDATLTFGFNSRLASVLQMGHPIPFGYKDDIALGMLGDVDSKELKTVVDNLAEIFGVSPIIEERYTDTVQRIAVVGAMTDALIRQAATQGVQLYITGQFRQPARNAVHETGMTVAIIGHATGEEWGLRALAGVLCERWTHLEVVVASINSNESRQ